MVGTIAVTSRAAMQAGSSMDTFAPSSSPGAPIANGDLEDPYLEVEGIEGSVLRAPLSALVVFPFGLAGGAARPLAGGAV